MLGMGWVLQLDGFYLFIFLGFVFNGFVEIIWWFSICHCLGDEGAKSDGVSLAQLLSFVFNEDEGFEEG